MFTINYKVKILDFKILLISDSIFPEIIYIYVCLETTVQKKMLLRICKGDGITDAFFSHLTE